MEQQSCIDGVTLITGVTVVDDDIVLGIDDREMGERVMGRECFVAKSVFDPANLYEMYMGVFEHYRDIEPRFSAFSWGMSNFWRVDDNPPKSVTKKVQAFYYDFSWNQQFGDMTRLTSMLARLRNRIGGLPEQYGFREEDDYYGIPLLHHVPVGGGFIGQHFDALKPQGCVVSLTVDKTFEEGGLFVVLNGERVLVEPLLEPGDLFIFRPDLYHGIESIDAEKSRDFNCPAGRWRMSTILVPPAEQGAVSKQ